MKISAMPAGAGGNPGTDLGNVNVGVTASSERLAAAKALAAGQEPAREEIERDPETGRIQSVRRITMKTNASPDRYDAQVAAEAPAEAVDSTKTDETGQTNAAVESTQPLSPQFAALAKERRALQVMKREIAEEKAKMGKPPEGEYLSKADLLANPLKIFDAGLTYDQLTEAILKNQSGITPEIQSLKAELKALKEGVDKTFTDRDTQAEKQVLSEMKREAQGLIQTGDDYEMVRETGSLPHVIDLIHRTYKTTGEVLDVQEALNLVETDLITETLKVANLKKVKSKIAPEPVQAPQSQGKQMKTLTNRDGSGIPLDRRARAIAAMNGTLRK
jgi:hypothetical protein